MEVLENFYWWHRRNFGDMARISYSDMAEKFSPDVKVSSFKNRSQEVKDKFNYKF